MSFVTTEIQDAVAVLTIDRPKALNALNPEVLADLKAAFEAIDQNTVRCVVLTGAGDKSFVAGADIGSMSTMTKAEGEAFGKLGNDVFLMIESFPLPVIAAVNGFALGGGNELAMSCDIRLCSDNAVFGQPEVGLGITPGFGGTQRLARLVGMGMAKQLVYSALNIKADEALRIGLVNAVYTQEELMPAALKLGGFEIRVNGKPVLAQLAQSRKATALVQYLVLRRGERVSHKVLTDTLWAGERSTNPDMALRAILHRFRLMIDAEGLDEMKGCIVTSRGYYQWNPHLDCSVDVFEVNDLSELARKESDAEKRSRIYEQIVNLYDGRLLPQSASEPWVESVSVRLHGQYRTAILNLLELCKKWGESTRIVTLCTRALELDPYEERLYLEKIVALETLGRHEEAEDLARRGSAMGCLHHAIEPGRAGSAYRQMRQADRNMESEVSKLISALPDTDNTGACICDFETFKEIYRVQRGVQVRYGLQVFLAILTVAPSQNTDAAETALMVEQLGDLIRTNLRQCDVGARYTDMQYVVMLSGSTAESGTSPLERIKAAFYRIPAHGRYLLSYSLYVPEAKADSGRARRRKKTAKKEK